MQAALLAFAILAADSQALPRAELDDAIRAVKATELAKLDLKLAEAKRAVAAAVKLPAAERREAAATARANVKAIEAGIAAAKKAPGGVPHLCFQKLEAGQVGSVYYFGGPPRGPYKTEPDSQITWPDGSSDSPAVAELSEIIDATTAIGAYKGVTFKIRTDTAGLKVGDKVRLDVPLAASQRRAMLGFNVSAIGFG